jgi:hypothetical protein
MRVDRIYHRSTADIKMTGANWLTFNYAKVFVDKLTSYLMSDINFAVAQNLPSSEMSVGRKIAVVFFDENNAKDAVIIAVYT